MENAKDTFYIALRDRLKALNPQRTITLRGVQRPGILVEEAESVMARIPADVFILRWTDLKTDTQLPFAMTQMTCEIEYATSGTQANAGLDRGRALSKLDAELLTLLSPSSVQKMDYTRTPAVAMGTMVFWGDPELLPEAVLQERLSRTVRVTVFAFQEQGEQ